MLLTPLAVACAAADLPQGGLDAPDGSASGKCKADAVSKFVGELATEALGKDILEQSGSRELRWGAPDTAFTMDYREDRVNVMYNKAGIIERIYCG